MNFTDLPEFHGFATTRNITSPELRDLHYKNWRLKIGIWRLYFSSCLPKGDLRICLNSSPACLVTLACVAGKISSLFAVVFRCQGRKKIGSIQQVKLKPACLNCSFPASPSLFAGFWWNPTITKCHATKKIVGYRLYSGVFAIVKQSGPRESLERRKVEPEEMRCCRQSTLVHLLKSFPELHEHDIERAWYCPQSRESVNMKTFDTRMVSQNGSIKGMSLGSAASPHLSPPGHCFFLFDPVFSPFRWLRSWFQTIQIWSIRNRETILNER